jgi:glycosyltransferase involved in cell wall biosynthesis
MVMTIHDTNHMVFPQYYTKIHQFYYRHIVKPCALKSKKIITVSDFSRTEIIRYMGVSAEKIEVTYNGVDPNYRVITDREVLASAGQKYDLPDKFTLCISNRKPHKNLGRLFEAYAGTDTRQPLYISGEPDAVTDSLIIKSGAREKIKFIGRITEEDLPVLYNLADLFVFPSLYEGFGLPPLEAMACGTPVITSRTSSLPEVVGEAAVTVDPYNVEELTAAINSVLHDEKMKAGMTKSGLKQAKKFSWQETARQTIDIYSEVLHN